MESHNPSGPYDESQLHCFVWGRLPIDSPLYIEMSASFLENPNGQIGQAMDEVQRSFGQEPDLDWIVERVLSSLYGITCNQSERTTGPAEEA